MRDLRNVPDVIDSSFSLPFLLYSFSYYFMGCHGAAHPTKLTTKDSFHRHIKMVERLEQGQFSDTKNLFGWQFTQSMLEMDV